MHLICKIGISFSRFCHFLYRQRAWPQLSTAAVHLLKTLPLAPSRWTVHFFVAHLRNPHQYCHLVVWFCHNTWVNVTMYISVFYHQLFSTLYVVVFALETYIYSSLKIKYLVLYSPLRSPLCLTGVSFFFNLNLPSQLVILSVRMSDCDSFVGPPSRSFSLSLLLSLLVF